MQRALILAGLWAAPIIATESATVETAQISPLAGGVQSVEIQTSDEMKLAATFYEPRKKERSPAVLLVHDAGGNRDQLQGIAESLQKRGFGVLAVDLRGHGESKSDKVDWQELDEKGQASLWQLAPRDISAAADWLLEQELVHSTNLSMVGFQAGCALAARHAEQDENVISMVLLSPRKQDFGFDVEQTILNVNGLPTYVVDKKNPEVERMVTEANAMGSSEWITFDTVNSKKTTVLDDRKTASRVSKWLAEIALPKKGR